MLNFSILSYLTNSSHFIVDTNYHRCWVSLSSCCSLCRSCCITTNPFFHSVLPQILSVTLSRLYIPPLRNLWYHLDLDFNLQNFTSHQFIRLSMFYYGYPNFIEILKNTGWPNKMTVVDLIRSNLFYQSRWWLQYYKDLYVTCLFNVRRWKPLILVSWAWGQALETCIKFTGVI